MPYPLSLPPSKTTRPPWLWGGLVLGGLALTGWLTLRPPLVETTEVVWAHPAQNLALHTANGKVMAQRTMVLSSKGSGRLAWMLAKEGDTVSEGEVVARLENGDAAAARDRAQASLTEARTQESFAEAAVHAASALHQRAEVLFSQRLLATSALDAAEAKLRHAKDAEAAQDAAIDHAAAALRDATAALEATLIRAPFNGIVVAKHANLGDVLIPPSPTVTATLVNGAVVTLVDRNSLQIEVPWAEADHAALRVGQPCALQLQAQPGQAFEGQVVALPLPPALLPSHGTPPPPPVVKIRISAAPDTLRPKQWAKVFFLPRTLQADDSAPHLAVPSHAIDHRSQPPLVWRVIPHAPKGPEVQALPVVLGDPLGEVTLVMGALNAGGKLVRYPTALPLYSGQTVRLSLP